MQRSFFPILFGAATLSLLLACGADAAPKGREKVQILVKPKVQANEVALHAILSAHGGEEHETIPALKVRVIRVPEHAAPKLLEALKRHRDVEYAEPDFAAQALASANDPYYTAGYQWHLGKIQAPNAWEIDKGSTNVVVAVVDTGVNASHPDLSGKVLPGYDFVSNDRDASDDNGHGTAAAGTASATSNNGIGVASVSWANPILPVKVLDAAGSGTYSAIANAIIFAADNGARIINLSLGGTSSSRTLQDAVNYAWSKDAVLIAAAGNDGNNTPVYPAACQNVVSVSATNRNDSRPSWSNYGSYVDVAAPGEDITTLALPNTYSSWSGTSFSCPVAAGVTALMASSNPQLSNRQIVDLLVANSDDIGAAGYDVYYGHGRVNALRAVSAAGNLAASDLSNPVVSIVSPADEATVAGTASVQVAATDNIGVSKVEIFVDGTLLAEGTAATASFAWNTLTHADGVHTIQARAYDAAGNVGEASVAVSVQNSTAADVTAPTVAITSPTEGSSISTRTTKIRVVSSDNVAVTKVDLYIDGKFAGTTAMSTATFSWNTKKVSRSYHTLQAYAWDAEGNVAASPLVTVRR